MYSTEYDYIRETLADVLEDMYLLKRMKDRTRQQSRELSELARLKDQLTRRKQELENEGVSKYGSDNKYVAYTNDAPPNPAERFVKPPPPSHSKVITYTLPKWAENTVVVPEESGEDEGSEEITLEPIKKLSKFNTAYSINYDEFHAFLNNAFIPKKKDGKA